MSGRAESEKQKLIQDKCQVILGNLLREEDNKYCVDCDAKGPRWASWNLGIFLCIRCAGIHRNLGVHISKVKSVNLDTWTPEQVACLQQMGNSQARAVYEANLPDNFRRPQTDSSLEAFIRAKYEQKKYIAKEWIPPPAPKPAFDIEEEKRKEKEKKKSRTKATNIEIPTLPQHPTALPRPHSAGPQSPSTKTILHEPVKSSVQVPGSTDLLNLGEGPSTEDDNIFNAFLSAPIQGTDIKTSTSIPTELPTSEISAEEKDFFNHKETGESLQSNKMTKESILSLYGSNACQMSHQIPPVYAMPAGGIFVRQQAYTQVGIPGYSPVPNSGINANIPGTNMPALYNPFNLGPSSGRQQANVWTGVPSNNVDDSLLMTQGMGQVQHQMANLQLTNQAWNVGVNVAPLNSGGMVIGAGQPTAGMVWPPATQCQSLSTNIWQ